MSSSLPNYCNQEAFEQFLSCLPMIETNDGLLHCAIAVSRHFLDASQCESVPWVIASYSQEVMDRVQGHSQEALLAHLHDVLFDEHGFTGNNASYYDVDNSLLPMVIESKLGLPITLTLIYKIVAEEIGLRVDGINSPGHFLARAYLRHETMIIDPFHQGRILSTRESLELITGHSEFDAESLDQYLPTCTHRQWIARILNNLVSVLLSQSRFDDVSAMRELLVALIGQH
jgi:regulator of sirC expression with transglutaminase-like and TPR domain